jgi:hypothetical protein
MKGAALLRHASNLLSVLQLVRKNRNRDSTSREGHETPAMGLLHESVTVTRFRCLPGFASTGRAMVDRRRSERIVKADNITFSCATLAARLLQPGKTRTTLARSSQGRPGWLGITDKTGSHRERLP